MLASDAQTKICPLIQINDGCMPMNNGTTNVNCQAEKCMAWHWHVEACDEKHIEYSKTEGYCRLIHEGES